MGGVTLNIVSWFVQRGGTTCSFDARTDDLTHVIISYSAIMSVASFTSTL